MVWMKWNVGRAMGLAALVGCGPGSASNDTTATTGPSTGTSGDSVDGSTSTSGEPPSTSSEVSTAVDSSSGPTIPDVGRDFQCDVWTQNCPAGLKCMPWANDGGAAFNDTRCVDIVDDPAGIDEPCQVFDDIASGRDDCELGAMCWFIDPDTLTGTCRPMCTGSELEPHCEDACDYCPITAQGVIIVCNSPCNPLTQDCQFDGWGCYPVDSAEAFTCVPDASAEGAGVGTACEYINDCPSGMVCADAASVPDCTTQGCCTPLCDVDAAGSCDDGMPGTVCTPWTELPDPDRCTPGTLGSCRAP